MALDRWDPWRDMMSLRDTMERLIQENFARPAGSLLPSMRGLVPLDVIEKGDAFEVRASLPGVNPDDVQVTVQGDTLTIRGETVEEDEHKEENWILRERRAGSFYRSVALPATLDADRASARFDQGVLTLSIPKAEAAKAKQIAVSGAKQKKLSAQISGATSGEAQQPGEDVVTEASKESFPASDSPAWTSDTNNPV